MDDKNKHDHSHDADYSRVNNRRSAYTPYQPGVKGCRECEVAAAVKNGHLEKAATKPK